MERRGRDTLIEELMRKAFELAWAVNHEIESPLHGREPLTFSRLMVLRLLAKTGPHNVRDVAAFLGVSDAAASKTIDKLVSRKLLQRVESRSDRRVRELSLTPIARHLLSEYEIARKHALAETFRECSPEDLHRASEVLDRVSWCIANRSGASNGGHSAPHCVSPPARPGFGGGFP
jgi:DNA-binding MarR family transcriptional regulator